MYRFVYELDVEANSVAEALEKLRAVFMDKECPCSFTVFKDGRYLREMLLDPLEDGLDTAVPVIRMEDGAFKPLDEAQADIRAGVQKAVCKFCEKVDVLTFVDAKNDAHCEMCDCWQNGEFILSLTEAGRAKVREFVTKHALSRVHPEDYIDQAEEIAEDLLSRPHVILDLAAEDTILKEGVVLRLRMADYEAIALDETGDLEEDGSRDAPQ